MKFDNVSYNEDWIKSHKSEGAFVAKCKILYPKMSEAKAKEIYTIACPKKEEIAKDKKNK